MVFDGKDAPMKVHERARRSNFVNDGARDDISLPLVGRNDTENTSKTKLRNNPLYTKMAAHICKGLMIPFII